MTSLYDGVYRILIALLLTATHLAITRQYWRLHQRSLFSRKNNCKIFSSLFSFSFAIE